MLLLVYSVAIAILLQSISLSFGLSLPSPESQVEQQLGYVPSNFVRIATFTKGGDPLVLMAYPISGGSERRQRQSKYRTPFPTLFWLCNSQVNRAVADLESRGYIKRIADQISNSPSYERTEDLVACNQDYAKQRWESLTEEDRLNLPDNVVATLMDSGVAGVALEDGKVPSIKCLHAHYAHYRATGRNPVGRIVHEILREERPSLDL